MSAAPEHPIIVLAKAYEEIQKPRIAMGNRHDAIIRLLAGGGYTARQAEISAMRWAAIRDGLQEMEDSMAKLIESAMRTHPLKAFMDGEKGLGAVQLARLLGEVGNPAWNAMLERPRQCSELRSFCGLAPRDGRRPRKRKGEAVRYSPTAK